MVVVTTSSSMASAMQNITNLRCHSIFRISIARRIWFLKSAVAEPKRMIQKR